jgi:hypothetical protein
VTKILLDTGSSGVDGWSSISRYLRCPQLYFWHEAAEAGWGGSGFTQEVPLVRGSIVHAGLAHLYTRQRLVQEGREDEFARYYSPREAMERVAEKFEPAGIELLPVAERVVAGYVARRASENLRTIAVERLAVTEFCGWRYTARIDWEYEDRAGKVWITDHKCVSKLEGKVYNRYTMSGQILGLWHIGAREYGAHFGGVQVNFLGVSPQAYDRVSPEPAPWMLARFPGVVARAHEGIERERERMKRDPEYVLPATPSEYTCFPYNRPCPFFEACRWGRIEGAATIGVDLED